MPTRYRILLAKRAATDLEGISDYIAKDSPTNAAKMVARILDAIELLKIFPHRNVLESEGQAPGAHASGTVVHHLLSRG